LARKVTPTCHHFRHLPAADAPDGPFEQVGRKADFGSSTAMGIAFSPARIAC